MAEYNFNDFKEACINGHNVFVWKPALRGAQEVFNLKTEEDLLSFIGNDGLENLDFINTAPWKENPKPEHEIFIDAYGFKTLGIHGYIAFFYNNNTKKWNIKSFKLNEQSFMPIQIAYQRALKDK